MRRHKVWVRGDTRRGNKEIQGGATRRHKEGERGDTRRGNEVTQEGVEVIEGGERGDTKRGNYVCLPDVVVWIVR